VGDTDDDWDVDAKDYSTLIGQFGLIALLGPLDADADGDFDVDIDDFAIMRSNFQLGVPSSPGAEAAPAAVPEPATLCLLALGGLALLRRRR